MLHFSGGPASPPRQRKQPAAALATSKSMHTAALVFYRVMHCPCANACLLSKLKSYARFGKVT